MPFAQWLIFYACWAPCYGLSGTALATALRCLQVGAHAVKDAASNFVAQPLQNYAQVSSKLCAPQVGGTHPAELALRHQLQKGLFSQGQEAAFEKGCDCCGAEPGA